MGSRNTCEHCARICAIPVRERAAEPAWITVELIFKTKKCAYFGARRIINFAANKRPVNLMTYGLRPSFGSGRASWRAGVDGGA